MPETQKYVRPMESFKEYGHPRTHVELAVFVRDLKENPGQWYIYTVARSIKGALDVISKYRTNEKAFKFLRPHRKNVDVAFAADPDLGPMVVIRWVP